MDLLCLFHVVRHCDNCAVHHETVQRQCRQYAGFLQDRRPGRHGALLKLCILCASEGQRVPQLYFVVITFFNASKAKSPEMCHSLTRDSSQHVLPAAAGPAAQIVFASFRRERHIDLRQVNDASS